MPFSPEEQRRQAREAVASSRLFSCADSKTIDMIVDRSLFVNFIADDVIFKRNWPVERMLIVIDGRLDFSISRKGGRKFMRWHSNPGQMVSLLAAIDGHGSIYDVWASKPTTAVSIPRDAILDAILVSPALAMSVCMAVCRQGRDVSEMATAEILLTMREKVAKALLSLDAEREAGGTTVLYTQEDMADLLSVSRQRLNVTLKEFEAQGLIKVGRADVTILDKETLRNMVFNVPGNVLRNYE